VEACYKLVVSSWGKYWIRKKDNLRSTRPLFTLGKWCAQGHFSYGDGTYLAGEASKSSFYRLMIRQLAPYTAKAELLLRKYCDPTVIARIEAIPEDDRPFGLFSLVMAAKGTTRFHKDKNDLVSVTIILHKVGKGAQYDLGETDFMVNPMVGDAIVGDGSTYIHGNRRFMGSQEDRVALVHSAPHHMPGKWCMKGLGYLYCGPG
jgi:hypothetical protein